MSDEAEALQARIRGMSGRDAQALAAELEARGRASHEVAAGLLTEPTARATAALVLERGGELGLRALLVRAPAEPAAAIARASALEAQLRERVRGWLEGLLASRARVPVEPAPYPQSREEQPPARRVCDVAYLALRQLGWFGEDEVERGHDRAFFFDLTDASRDRVIAAAIASGDFRAMHVDPPSDHPEGP